MPDQHSYASAGVDINAGDRAVDLMRAHAFDLAICDVMMPETDGYAANLIAS